MCFVRSIAPGAPLIQSNLIFMHWPYRNHPHRHAKLVQKPQQCSNARIAIGFVTSLWWQSGNVGGVVSGHHDKRTLTCTCRRAAAFVVGDTVRVRVSFIQFTSNTITRCACLWRAQRVHIAAGAFQRVKLQTQPEHAIVHPASIPNMLGTHESVAVWVVLVEPQSCHQPNVMLHAVPR